MISIELNKNSVEDLSTINTMKKLGFANNEIQKKYDEQNELLNYKSKLKSESESFHNYLGSCSRYLQNKRLEDIKYHG